MTLQIGWPSADGRGKFDWVGRSELPSIVFLRHTSNLVGDITGKGTGTDGTARERAARGVGVGDDAEYLRAQAGGDFAARSPWIVELTEAERSLGNAILLMAGGREFVRGQQVRINGSGQAARAARYIVSGGRGKDGKAFAGRGRMPSDTSMDDAAAAAAAALVLHVHAWEYALGVEELDGGRIWSDATIRSHLAGVAWRAAFRSFTDDAAAESGCTVGRHAGEQEQGVPLALDVGQLASQRASLQAWARGEQTIEETTEHTARRALASWLWRSLVPGRKPGANEKRARAGAIRRARFLIRLVHGASWSDAARLAGFADGGAASHVLAMTHTWAALARAQAAESGQHPTAAGLRRQWMRAARAAVAARRAARPFLSTSAPRGRRGGVRRVVGAVLADGAGVLVRGVRLAGPRVSGRIASLAVDIGAAAARAIDAREQAARKVSGAAARLAAFRARAARSWESASRGLRRGVLRS